MSKPSEKNEATPYPEYAVRAKTIGQFFSPPLASSTFHDLVKKGKITPFKHLAGFYMLNDSLRRLGLTQVQEMPKSPSERSMEDIVRLAFTLIDRNLFPEPSWLLTVEAIDLKVADHARMIADRYRAKVERYDNVALKLAYQPKPGEVLKGRHSLQIQGMFGGSTLRRAYYYHPGKKHGHHPADEVLGLEGGHTPALSRLICLEGSDETSYQKAALHLQEVGGMLVGERQIQREVLRIGPAAAEWLRRESLPQPCEAKVLYIEADYTGVPMRREELEGRKGKAPDGKAKTRMAALGCVFTQHQLDEKGRPLRDHQSTTYLAGFESPSDFGIGLRREALRRGMGSVNQVVVLVDGALGLEKMGIDYFPQAAQIVDNYHGIEHLELLIEALLTKADARRFARRRHHWRKMLLADGVERIIARARKEAAGTAREETVEAQLGYFVHNVERMQYGTFRKKGWFIGSGVVEAGCRSVIGQRCKQSGMFWTEKGASAVMALRCLIAGNRLKAFWNARHTVLAA